MAFFVKENSVNLAKNVIYFLKVILNYTSKLLCWLRHCSEHILFKLFWIKTTLHLWSEDFSTCVNYGPINCWGHRIGKVKEEPIENEIDRFIFKIKKVGKSVPKMLIFVILCLFVLEIFLSY